MAMAEARDRRLTQLVRSKQESGLGRRESCPGRVPAAASRPAAWSVAPPAWRSSWRLSPDRAPEREPSGPPRAVTASGLTSAWRFGALDVVEEQRDHHPEMRTRTSSADELYQATRSWAGRAYADNLIHCNRLDRGAGTSPPGSSRSSSPKSCARASDHCARLSVAGEWEQRDAITKSSNRR